MSSGEARPQQLEMAAAVARALGSGRHLVVQAGTGTGKSLAYVVPAVLSGRRVVVATATKALQDQLAGKDLPAVAEAGLPFTFAVLKGRSNYLCVQRAEEVGARPVGTPTNEPTNEPPAVTSPATLPDLWSAADGGGEQDGPVGGAGPHDTDGPDGTGGLGGLGGTAGIDRLGDEPARGLVAQVQRLLEWAGRTETGDRADLPFEPDPRAWSMLSVGPRECPGAYRCPSGERCFAEQARAEAAGADVVVVNTHLYGAHLASGGVVLPPHDVVIFDEAHEVEEIMTSSLGVEVTPGRLRSLVALARPLLRGDGAAALDQLADAADRLQSDLAVRVGQQVLTTAGPGGAGAPRPGGTPGAGAVGRLHAEEPPGWERTLRAAAGRPSSASGPTSGAGRPVLDVGRGADAGDDGGLAGLLALATARVQGALDLLRRTDQELSLLAGDAASGRRGRALSAAGHLAEDLARLAARADDEVAWVDGGARSPVLRLSPIDVAPSLARMLWSGVTAVLTSATIPLRLVERLGLPAAEVEQIDVGSPFDYRSHALLYVARHLPDRRRPESSEALHGELESLIRAAGGRTLALFTSHRANDAAVSALRGRLPYRLLVQGELPKGRLLEAFAADESSCLFATLGFWQGVDVPGRALSLVTLDRLPFGRPDDPLLMARRERAGDAAFSLVDLPRAAALLAQGAGRLIRTSADRGVVAVLDPRLATAGYRRVLLSGFPPMRRTTDRRQVEEFLARVLSG